MGSIKLNSTNSGSVTLSAPDTINNYTVTLPSSNGTLVYDSTVQSSPFTPAGTGAVSRTVQSKLRDVVSVKDFGAVGDGVTDDTAAINLAIVALNASQIKTLYFPSGSYIISSALTSVTKSGVSIYGTGPRQTVIKQTTNSNIFNLISTDPTNTRLSDFTLQNIGFEQTISAPSVGTVLTLTRVDRSYFNNIDIRNVFSGISIKGGADIHFSNITITSAYSWTTLANNSTLLNITYDQYAGEIPSEIFIDNFNFKGSSSWNAPCYLNYCVVINCGDGIFFTGGHLGVSDYAPIFINPLAVTNKNIQNIEFSNVYSDGNGSGSLTSSCVDISGSTIPILAGIKFTGCSIKNYDGNGIAISDTSAKDIKITGCEISNIGGHGITAIGVDNLSITSNTISDTNKNNNSSNGIALYGVNGGIINGNIIESITYQNAYGVSASGTCSDIIICNNIMTNNAVDFTTGNTRIKFVGNLKYGSVPTVVCSDGFIPVLGYSFVIVTGNTNFSNIGGVNIPGYEVTFQFTGTPTAYDNAGNIKLTSNFVATAGSTLTMICDGTNWIEKSRAII